MEEILILIFYEQKKALILWFLTRLACNRGWFPLLVLWTEWRDFLILHSNEIPVHEWNDMMLNSSLNQWRGLCRAGFEHSHDPEAGSREEREHHGQEHPWTALPHHERQANHPAVKQTADFYTLTNTWSRSECKKCVDVFFSTEIWKIESNRLRQSVGMNHWSHVIEPKITVQYTWLKYESNIF